MLDYAHDLTDHADTIARDTAPWAADAHAGDDTPAAALLSGVVASFRLAQARKAGPASPSRQTHAFQAERLSGYCAAG